jgi:nucleotide-binding universal stress UspA family protein
MFQRILVATDRISDPEPVVLSGVKMAAHHRAELMILHTLEVPSEENGRRIRHFRSGEKIAIDADYESEVRRELQAVYGPYLNVYGRAEFRVGVGFPWLDILKTARRTGVDLIIIGPHRKTGTARVKGKIGSTAEGIIRREPCPLWIVNRTMASRMVRLERLLVAVDFSESCRHALKFALRIARRTGARLNLFHMHGIPPSPHYDQTAFARDAAQARQRLTDFSSDVPADIEREYFVRGGVHPHLEITTVAERTASDLIVMGSHSKSGEKKWYVGSAVERVSQRAPCPVAVITDPKVLWQTDEI